LTGALDQPSGSVLFHPADNVNSYSAQWNLNVQREIPGNTFLEVAYVGNRGLHLPALINLNQPFLDSQGTRSRLYGNRITGLKTWTTIASSSYHSLQVKAERRLTKGFQFLASYTLSKAIDDASLGFFPASTESNMPQDTFNRRAERGLSAFDVRNRFTVSYIWEIPFFRTAANPIVRTVLGGWQVNGLTTLSDGQPFTPIINNASLINPMFNDPTVTDLGQLRPNVLKNPNLPPDQRTIDRWFDVGAFDVAFPNQPRNIETFGNAGRNILEGPGFAATDISFFKEFAPSERWKIQFRAEFFNIFNRVNLLPPIRTVDLDGGKIVNAHPGREVQFGLKLLF
jgi:hypothetical protein